MPNFNIECTVFDPIRISTYTKIKSFIVDTWFDKGLISRSLFQRLVGLETTGMGRVPMSSGMYVNQPETQIGIQIKNLKAMPLTVNIVDDGPAPLLLGGDFFTLLFDIGEEVLRPDIPRITIETITKRSPNSLGIRLLSESKTIDSLELQCFINSVRSIHNVAVIANSGLHQHKDWQSTKDKVRAVEKTIYFSRDRFQHKTCRKNQRPNRS